MPQEPYNYNPITTLVVLTLLFCAFALFHWIIPMLCEDYRETHPTAKKPTKAEIAERNEIDRLLRPDELETAAKVISLDNHENAIS